MKPPTAKRYRDAKISEAFAFCPPIYPCKKCGWPVVDGYCCPTCGDGDPQSEEEQ